MENQNLISPTSGFLCILVYLCMLQNYPIHTKSVISTSFDVFYIKKVQNLTLLAV